MTRQNLMASVTVATIAAVVLCYCLLEMLDDKKKGEAENEKKNTRPMHSGWVR